jgi:hypothetical protein
MLDVTEMIGSQLPSSLRDRVASDAEKFITAAFSQIHGSHIIRVGNFLLTETRRNAALDELSGYAKVDATAQWEEVGRGSEKDVKFSLDRIIRTVPEVHRVLHILIEEKAVEKSLDEQFWTCISSFETPNEEEFAVYWTDRILGRFHTYNSGLNSVTDQKLHDQLAELLASYTQKDLLPDSITKAQAQGLVLSRKTRKNISKLESILGSSKSMDITALTTALEKFNKKQGIPPPPPSTLTATKQAMVDDMLRRLQKQKSSDGPVLFLTLIIVLFAKHYDGVVYATGKFAPKLLKQLKDTFEAGQYEQLERWKEAAKTSTLSAEDKAEMLKMAQG